MNHLIKYTLISLISLIFIPQTYASEGHRETKEIKADEVGITLKPVPNHPHATFNVDIASPDGGASILLIDSYDQSSNTSPHAVSKILLSKDPSDLFRIPAQKYSIVLDLGEEYYIEEFFFHNDTAVGTAYVTPFVELPSRDSIGKKSNQTVSIPLYKSKNIADSPSVRFDSVKAKYLLITFDTQFDNQPGHGFGMISDLRVFGLPVDPELASYRKLCEETIQQGARILYISSGNPEEAYKLVDPDFRTRYNFSENDHMPTVVVAYWRTLNVSKITAITKVNRSDVDIYLMRFLPDTLDEEAFIDNDHHKGPKQDTYYISQDFFDENIPTGSWSFTDTLDDKDIVINLNRSYPTRFAIIRYHDASEEIVYDTPGDTNLALKEQFDSIKGLTADTSDNPGGSINNLPPSSDGNLNPFQSSNTFKRLDKQTSGQYNFQVYEDITRPPSNRPDSQFFDVLPPTFLTPEDERPGFSPNNLGNPPASPIIIDDEDEQGEDEDEGDQ